MTPPRACSARAARSHGVWSSREPRKPTIRSPAIRSRSDGPAEAGDAGDREGGVDAGDEADGGDPDGTAAVGPVDAVALAVGAGRAGEPHAARNRPTPPTAVARRKSRRETAESDRSGAAGGRRRLMPSAYGPRPF